MTDEENAEKKRSSRGWILAGYAILLVVVAIVWATTGTRTASGPEPAASSGTTSAAPAGESGTASPTSSAHASDAGSPIPPETDPVPLTDSVVSDSGVVVRLEKLESVVGEAGGPGETSGPAIRVTVEIVNGSTDDLTLAYTAVNLYYGSDRIPAPTIIQPGGSPFEGSVAPGESAVGVYLFTVREDERGDVTIGFDYQPGEPTVVFQGAFG
ncbi:hypothetical protein [uncultured Microbacterium sp.]|uniref:hypothetical protein n=1 Tax=uncultured Microbacterium sp. TaxID=191216 RepID=UPI0028EC24EC|nr:hypothetical protein [uncultured Microbacterium sp.]